MAGFLSLCGCYTEWGHGQKLYRFQTPRVLLLKVFRHNYVLVIVDSCLKFLNHKFGIKWNVLCCDSIWSLDNKFSVAVTGAEHLKLALVIIGMSIFQRNIVAYFFLKMISSLNWSQRSNIPGKSIAQ